MEGKDRREKARINIDLLPENLIEIKLYNILLEDSKALIVNYSKDGLGVKAQRNGDVELMGKTVSANLPGIDERIEVKICNLLDLGEKQWKIGLQIDESVMNTYLKKITDYLKNEM